MELKQSQYWRNQIRLAFARRHTSSIAKASLKNKIEQARRSDAMEEKMNNKAKELIDMFSLTNNKLNTDIANDTVDSLTNLFKNHKERDTFAFLLYLNRKIDKLLKQNHSEQDKQKLQALQEAVLSKKEDRRKILFNN